ncbi:hypothetical protein TNCV_1433671 [Trichonephila clavipes]|nr:hypothetical protein TNCV_1433671 [Trichonephila clavipes]
MGCILAVEPLQTQQVSNSSVYPTPLAHADTQRDVHPKGNITTLTPIRHSPLQRTCPPKTEEEEAYIEAIN